MSLVSSAGAAANLATELPAWDFDATHTAAITAWNTRLGALTVYGGTQPELQTFYSALHHTFVMPGVYSDTNGSFTYEGTTMAALAFLAIFFSPPPGPISVPSDSLTVPTKFILNQSLNWS